MSRFKLHPVPGERPAIPPVYVSDVEYRKYEEEVRSWEASIVAHFFQKKRIEQAIATEESRQDNMERLGMDAVRATTALHQRPKHLQALERLRRMDEG